MIALALTGSTQTRGKSRLCVVWQRGQVDSDEGLMRPLNPITRAAIALHRRPGAYAVLLGAGISRGSAVPTAWEILEALIRDGGCSAPGVWRHRFRLNGWITLTEV